MDPALQFFLVFGGLLYALCYCIVLYRWPAAGMMLIFALTPFQNDLSLGGPVKFSVAEINLWLALPVFFIRRRSVRLGPLTIPVLSYLVVGGVSSVLNWTGTMTSEAMVGAVSYLQTFQYWVVAVIFFAMMPRRVEEYRASWIGLLLVGGFLAAVLLITRTNYILGLHKNGVGASMACAFVVAVELWFAARSRGQRLRMSAITVLLAAGLLLSLSRGAWLGAGLGVLLIVTMRRQFKLFVGIVLVVAPVLAILWQTLPEDARTTAGSLDAGRENIRLRYESVAKAKAWFLESPVYGLGVGLRKRYDATNIIMLKLAETGVLGLAAFLSMHLVFFAMLWSAQRGLSRTDPVFSALAIGGALVLYKFGHGLVDHYWSRGALMCATGGAGMALRGYLEVTRRRRLARQESRLAQVSEPMAVFPAEAAAG